MLKKMLPSDFIYLRIMEEAMNQFHLGDRNGIIVAVVSLIVSFLYIFFQTNEFLGSFSAAVITAGLVWATYLIILWFALALKK